ncbi:phytanoyl-CoA dioxygenase family protein [Nonomuraea sp. NPDC003754]
MPVHTPFSLADQHAFIHDGLLIRRGLIPDALLQTAQAHIDDWYERDLNAARIETYTQKTFAPELGSHSDLLALYTASGAISLAAQLVQPACLAPVSSVQVQIRIPQAALASAQPVKAMHVDGVACPHLEPRELRTFTLLVGVMLSHVTRADDGALHYLPGGHHRMARWFASERPDDTADQVPADVEADEGVALLGEPGDVIFMHHLVPHRVGANTSTRPRVMAYFRLSHTDHDRLGLSALRDPWAEYPHLAALASST